jgi:GR25 family glycosyltransferase involved in LPS biosynthesis
MMKAFVITIEDITESVEAARRCIESGKKFGIKVEHHWGNTPRNIDVHQWFREKGLPEVYFHEEYSRLENCLAAFSSHYTLWDKCARQASDFLILEHDAVFVDKLPAVTRGWVTNFGKPSYGNWQIPNFVGESAMFSKEYLPGAHAYKVTPQGAQELLAAASLEAGPTDLFIHSRRIPNLTEYYPWPVEVRETFSTIQRKMGCYAKHQYNENYELL